MAGHNCILVQEIKFNSASPCLFMQSWDTIKNCACGFRHCWDMNNFILRLAVKCWQTYANLSHMLKSWDILSSFQTLNKQLLIVLDEKLIVLDKDQLCHWTVPITNLFWQRGIINSSDGLCQLLYWQIRPGTFTHNGTIGLFRSSKQEIIYTQTPNFQSQSPSTIRSCQICSWSTFMHNQ